MSEPPNDFEPTPGWDDIPALAVAGPTYFDDVRHLIARDAFARLFAQDERTIAFYERWLRRLGLDVPLELWNRAALIIEQTTGQSVEAAIGTSEVLNIDVSEDEARLIERADQALLSASRGVSIEVLTEMTEDAFELVKSVGVRWAWLPHEVMRWFEAEVSAVLTGQMYEPWTRMKTPDPIARPAELHLVVRDGETVRQALERLEADATAFITAIQPEGASEMHLGTSVSEKERVRIERDVTWFYRARVKEPRDFVARIAAEADDFNDPRRSVYDALERAEKFLGHGQYKLQ